MKDLYPNNRYLMDILPAQYKTIKVTDKLKNNCM